MGSKVRSPLRGDSRLCSSFPSLDFLFYLPVNVYDVYIILKGLSLLSPLASLNYSY